MPENGEVHFAEEPGGEERWEESMHRGYLSHSLPYGEYCRVDVYQRNEYRYLQDPSRVHTISKVRTDRSTDILYVYKRV